ncbi:MAG: hypothetical protein R3E93_12265 [Thiothrix sp.]
MNSSFQNFLSSIFVVTFLLGSTNLMAESSGKHSLGEDKASTAASVKIKVMIPVSVSLSVTADGVSSQANVESGAFVDLTSCDDEQIDYACAGTDTVTATAL